MSALALTYLNKYKWFIIIPVALLVALGWAYYSGYKKANGLCSEQQYKTTVVQLQKQLAAARVTIEELQKKQGINHETVRVVKEQVVKYIPSDPKCNIPATAIVLLNTARSGKAVQSAK